MVQYIHKVKDGRDFYLVANSSNSSVALDVSLRGQFETLEYWDPMTGEILPVPETAISRAEDHVTIRNFTLNAIQAKFIVGKKTK